MRSASSKRSGFPEVSQFSQFCATPRRPKRAYRCWGANMPHAENLATQSYDELLAQAKQGDQLALGQLLELHRAYLKVLAERQLDRRLEARIDASDLIQQTCLSVFASFTQFAGQSEGEFAAWIQ